jgi:hypothetical protein
VLISGHPRFKYVIDIKYKFLSLRRAATTSPGLTQMSILADDFFGFEPFVFTSVYLRLHLAF